MPEEDLDKIVSVRVDGHGAAVIVRIAGEIDALTESTVRKPLFACLAAKPPAVVIDLEGVTFIGSTGLRLLAQACEQARRDTVAVSIVATTHAVLRLLEITGLDGHLPITGSVRDALAGATANADAG
ncbi:STAS domain-containing protein [Lentzea sp. NPDC060358]|uniref:STAS domain-containing protein n=1 Tax=Lentzea sp. NPDC060358 TaxID=3347103 RepID=UPI003663192A